MARFLRAAWTFENASRTDPQIEADLHQALQSKADFPEANGLLAIYYANNSKLPEALTLSQKAASFEPGNINRIILANVLLGMHRYDEAEAQAHQIAAATADNGVRTQANDILTHIAEARNYEAQARQRQQEAAARASAAAAARASVPAAQSNVVSSEKAPDPSEDADTPELTRRDAPPNVRGIVAQVRCNGNEMEVTVKTGAQPAPLIFRALDRTRIGYSSNTSAVNGDIEPCTELRGRTVRVDYKPSATKFFDGEVVQITVEK
jgi:tetratricopeptide (TPR) repeat protein